jgi:hypothetical protein
MAGACQWPKLRRSIGGTLCLGKATDMVSNATTGGVFTGRNLKVFSRSLICRRDDERGWQCLLIQMLNLGPVNGRGGRQ